MRAEANWRRLALDRRASTIVEFALLAPVMFLLICGGIEFGHFYLTWMTLEGATLEAARTAAASQEQSMAERDAAMRASVEKMMAAYPLQDGKQLTIEVKSYADFSNAATSEPYTDVNPNGKYDGPDSLYAGFPGEPFIDKNGNGAWDATIYKDKSVGAVGDVVSYKAVYPAAYYFPFLRMPGVAGLTLTTTAVTRNEPITMSSGAN